MGTWGTGPFDNDDAADFRGDLDHLDAPGRIKAIHGALEEAAQETATWKPSRLRSRRPRWWPRSFPAVSRSAPNTARTRPFRRTRRSCTDSHVRALDRVVAEDSEINE
jgi:hypothetical protein